MNLKRYKTISEMGDQEQGYISSSALGFDFDETGKELWLLFHYDCYSHTKHKSEFKTPDMDVSFNFDIGITCAIVDGKKTYIIKDTNHHIPHCDISQLDKKQYIILSVNESIIDVFDAEKINKNAEELEDGFFDFIQSVIEQDQDDETTHKLVADCRDNFADFMCFEYGEADNWEGVENILYNICLLSQSDHGIESIITNLSGDSYRDFLTSLAKVRKEGFVEDEIEGKIQEISICFDEFFQGRDTVNPEDKTQAISGPRQENVIELHKKRMESVGRDDFKQAAQMRDNINQKLQVLSIKELQDLLEKAKKDKMVELADSIQEIIQQKGSQKNSQ